MIASADEKVSLFACLGSKIFILYAAAEKRALAKMIQMEHVTILIFSVVVGHGLLQHAGTELEQSSRSHYYAHFIPYHVFLKDAISFAYEVSFSF